MADSKENKGDAISRTNIENKTFEKRVDNLTGLGVCDETGF